MARAALMAIRYPSDVMNHAGEDQHAQCGWSDGLDAGPIFTAMIDAILNEQPAPT